MHDNHNTCLMLKKNLKKVNKPAELDACCRGVTKITQAIAKRDQNGGYKFGLAHWSQKKTFFEISDLAAKCFARHLHKGKTTGNDELKRLPSLNALPLPVQCRLKTDAFSIFQRGYWSCLRVVVSWDKNGRMKRFWVVFVDFSYFLVLWISFSPIDFARRVVFMQLFASLRLTCRFRYVRLRARVPGTGRCCLVARKTTRRAPVVFF